MFKKVATLVATIMIVATLNGSVALAAGTGTENITGPASVVNGANATFVVSLSNLTGIGGSGVANYQGTFVYDTAYWDYVSFTSNAPFSMAFNSANGKFVGAGMGTYITSSSSNMFTIVLRAKQLGNTSVSLSGTEAGDSTGTLPGCIVTLTPASAKSVAITNAPILSSNNNLSALSVSGYTLSPTFSSGTTSYTLSANVPYTQSTITVNATKEDSAASISGAGSRSLSVGNNTINVVVTAENGTSKTYTITITRDTDTTPPPPAQSSDATLKSLNISGYTLTPSFNKNTTNYSITVAESIKGLSVTAVPTDSKATAVVSGNSGWGSGTNNITIKVTAENGSVKTYIVTVKRPGDTDSNKNKSSNNYLKELSVKHFSMNFNKNTNNYSITVPYEIDKLDLTAKSEDSKAKVEIIGNKDFKVDEINVVEVRVTAEDGSLRVYTLNVTRSSIVSKTKLTSLEVKDHQISPKFDPDKDVYSLTVPSSVTNLEIIYKTADKDAKVTITGDKDLRVGNNVVIVKVTDNNGFTRIYLINVEREVATTILGLNPFLFFSCLGLLLLGIILLILLLFKRKRERAEIPAESHDININVNPNFTPDVNIGSKNNSDFAADSARLIRGNSNETEGNGRKAIDAILTDTPEADTIPTNDSDDDLVGALMSSLKVSLDDNEAADKYDLDELMDALKSGDGNKVKMFIKEVKADDLKDELKGLDPDRYDDMFDDHPTVHEVVRAIGNWRKTGKTKELALLINQYEAEKLRQKIEKRRR